MGGTKTSKYHDFWICGPLGTGTYGFKYTKILETHKKMMGTCLKNNMFANLRFGKIKHVESFGPDLEKTGTDK